MTLKRDNEEKRFFNWYHGYTKIQLPKRLYSYNGQLDYFIGTSATSGTIMTKYFGENYTSHLVEKNLFTSILVIIPRKVRGNKNVTLSFKVDKITMPKREGNTDHFSVESTNLDDDNNHEVIKFTPPDDRGNRNADHHRDITSEYLKNMPFDSMPGFRFSWFYSDKELIPDASYRKDEETVLFVR